MVEAAHDLRLVIASLAVAMMAGFTGLSLTRGANALPVGRRKVTVSMAAVALGGGIWSMHFVAMLGLKLPFLYYYDTLITLISALVAILLTGIALLVLHFLPRTPVTITGAGVIIGIGIPIMHYIGMSGMELCRPIYTPLGVGLALVASIALSVAAVWLAYSERGRANILLGTAGFGLAVFSVHFLAMAGTGFRQDVSAAASGPLMGNESLAILVTLSAFVISAAFLLTGVTFAPIEEAAAAPPQPIRPAIPADDPHPAAALSETEAAPPRIPYERENRIFFLDSTTVAAMRAEGHYTIAHHGTERLFCPWSISEAQKRLVPAGFLRVHRSYLINPKLVSGFERLKDTGLLYFESAGPQMKVPVSRSNLGSVREALGL
jgi:NO-binding membrane sensor protein with MHYT domain